MKKTALVILILSLILSGFDGSERESRDEYLLFSINVKDLQTFSAVCPDADQVFMDKGRVFFNLNETEIKKLQSSGIEFTYSSLLKNQRALSAAGDINGPFHNYNETAEFLDNLHSRFPELTEIGSAGISIEGRNLNYIKISNPTSVSSSKPNIYILGCHHAREWISVEVPLLFAQYLLENYGSDPEVAGIVNGSTIYILPIMNPDGLEYTIHYYRMWRKNRRVNGGNSFGVDINRNYGSFWGYDNSGSSPNPWSETYRGTAPFSEPETAGLQNFMTANPPSGVISYHSYSQAILYAWNYIHQTTPDNAELENLAKTMSGLMYNVNGRTYIYGCGADALYTTNGDTVDYVYDTFKVPAFTIELPPIEFSSGGFIVSETDIDSVFNENLPALLYFAGHFIK